MDLPVRAEFHFSQDGDSCGGGDYQDLRVSVEDAGGGSYLILKTDRWAISPEDLDAFVKRLKWCVSSCRSIFDEEDKPKDEGKPKGDHPATAIAREAFNARIEELKQLKSGWLDGDGVPLSHEGLDWLACQFRTFYPADLPLPCLFPTTEGRVLVEWGRVNDNPWAIGFEIDLETMLAKYNRTNIRTGESFDVNLDAKPVHSFWEWIAAQIRTYVGKIGDAT